MHKFRFFAILVVLIALASIFSSQFPSLPQVNDLPLKLESLQSLVSAPEPLRSNSDSPNSFLTRAGVVKWTNSERAKNGLASLTINRDLNAAALARIKDMFSQQYFAHVSPQGQNASDLAAQARYEYISIGENLALGNFENDEVLVEAWMGSPGHRANILGTSFSDIGVAVGQGTFEGRKTWLAVQIFALPRSACPAVNRDLKSNIDSNQKRLAEILASLDVMRKELEKMQPKKEGEYSAKVEAFNAKVNEYNAVLQETRDLIAQYNNQANSFNSCLNR